MKRAYCIFLFVTLAMNINYAFAGNGKLYTSYYLSCSQMSRLCQDSHGFIWAGTEYGLNKFDGYHFTNYFFDGKNPTSISNNDISAFLCDSKDRLWIGTAIGLCRYNYHNDCFERHLFPNDTQPRVTSIIEMHNGDIIVGTAGCGLYKIRKNTEKLIKDDELCGNDGFFSHVFEDSHHNIWKSNNTHIFTKYIIGNGKLIRREKFTSPFGRPVKFIENHRGSILIICYDNILRYDYSDGQIHNAGYDVSKMSQNNRIYDAIITHNGELYVSTSENGVMKVKRGQSKLHVVESRDGRFSLDLADVNSIIEDRDNNIWSSCYNKGLYLIPSYSMPIADWSFSNYNYLMSSNVAAIAKGNGGDTWCAVSHSGIYKFNSKGVITSHPSSPIGTNYIYRDGTGQYWISTIKMLYSYNPITGVNKPELPLYGWGVRSMADNGKGVLYISDFGKGLLVYDTQNKLIKRYVMDTEAIVNDWILTMFVDHNGILWIGTSNGISFLDTHKHNHSAKKWKNALLQQRCNAMCETHNGNIIIATNMNIYLYQHDKRCFSPISGSEFIASKNICAVIEDDKGDIWISTAKGIWQYDHRYKKFISHGSSTQEYSHGAVLHRDDDLIEFGSIDGITSFYPNAIKGSHLKLKKLALTKFVIDGHSQDCMNDKFTIEYSQKTFSLEFSLLNYHNTANTTLIYRLNKGKWIYIEEGQNRLSFNELAPGKYRLQVMAVCNGAYSYATKDISIYVKGPWYVSAPAISSYIILFIIAGISVFFDYKRKQKREIEEANVRFLINATHDIRSPLTLILGPLQKLKRRITDEDSKLDLETINRNANRLLILVNQILDQHKIDKNMMQLHCKNTDMVKFISNICMLYQYNASQRNISLQYYHYDDSLYVWIDRMNFDKVMCNLISNALKFTPDGGTIIITLAVSNNNASITVADTGPGLSDKDANKIFDRFYQGDNSNKYNVIGTGIGLNISRTIVQMHGGKIKAANRTDGTIGACFTILLPLGKAHLKSEEIDNDERDVRQIIKKKAYNDINIMIVDDDPEIALFIESELGKYYHFNSFRNGKDALRELITSNYDLVISDVMMPDMDGIELLQEIKGNSITSSTPVILLTSKAEVSDRLEGLKHGADAFLAKPFYTDELHIQINNIIDNVRRLRGKYSGALEQKDKIKKIKMKSFNDELMERIINTINENISDKDFNVDKLCIYAGISHAQLHRKMKEITGISASDFLRNIRLDQAAQLITECKVSISEVAYRVGFANQAHFSTVFRKRFGMTPSEYIKRHSKQ